MEVDLGKSGSKIFANNDERDGYLLNQVKYWSGVVSQIPDQYIRKESNFGIQFNNLRTSSLSPENILALIQQNVIYISESNYWELTGKLIQRSVLAFLGFLSAFHDEYCQYSILNDGQIPIKSDYIFGIFEGRELIGRDRLAGDVVGSFSTLSKLSGNYILEKAI